MTAKAAGRRAGGARACASRARCSSARPRCPNMAGSASATRRSPASPAIRGIRRIRRAARPAAARWRRCFASACCISAPTGPGSLRIPAAFTGVFGFKPSYGRVPAYPPSPFNVLAHQGPIARRVADAALMLSVISGPDARDMTAWNSPAEDFTAGLDDGVRGLARRLVAAARRRRRVRRRNRSGGAQGGAGAGRAGRHRRGSRSAARSARWRSSRRCGGRAPRRSSIPCRRSSAR